MTMELAMPISNKAKNICYLISIGYSVDKACRESHITNRTFWNEKIENPELDTEYVRARAARSDVRLEALEDKLEKIENGSLDPNAGRVVIDTIKWLMGKEKPKVYGDATILRGDKDNPIEIGLATSLQALDARRVVALIDKPVIDLEPIDARLNAKDFI